MKPNQKICKCQQGKFVDKGNELTANNFIVYIFLHVLLLIAWFGIYLYLKEFSIFVTYSLFHIASGSRLGSTIEFFLFDTPKIFMLLILVVYAVGLLRSFILSGKVNNFLRNNKSFVGNILAAMLGIITPFCSCSAVPLFIGFVSAGVSLGVTFSFLISAPMVNEVALILLYGLLGWKIAALYLVTGLSVAIIAGIIIGKLHPENYIEDWVKELRANKDVARDVILSWYGRMIYARKAIYDTLSRVWIYVIVGIAFGAIIHGYVPESFMTLVMGAHSWWSVPLAVLLGIPLYSNAAGIVPVVEALIGKGAAIGTVLAFMMSVIALSFPEMLMLRRVLKIRLIVYFLITVALGITIVGYLFNWLGSGLHFY